VEFHTYVVK